MRELEVGVDHAKGQRLAKCKARQTEHLNRAICASLAEELCTGVGKRAGVRAWLDGLLDSVWELTQAKQAWFLVRESQEMQQKLLKMMEEYGQELARARHEQVRKDKLEKLDSIKKYSSKRRLEAAMEAVREGMSILNLSEDWLEMMVIETRDQREIENMMDVTWSVLDVDESRISGRRRS